MIVSHEHRFVYVALPHTASTSTRRWLCKFYSGEIVGADHDCYIPDGCEDYTAWTVTRDPFDMACGMWRKLARNADRTVLLRHLRRNRLNFPASFREFALMLATAGLPSFPENRRFVHWPPSRHCKGVTFDFTFDFSEMPNCLAVLPFVDQVRNFPHLNKNEEELFGWTAPDTPLNRRLVDAWTEVNG